MTAVLTPSRPAVRVTPRGVAIAEWIKLRSLRSAAWLLAGIVVSIVGIGVMPALGVAVGALPPVGGADPAGGALDGLSAAQLLAGALGVVAVTSEYASPARSAICRCVAGGMTLSSVPTTAQLGSDFQPGSPDGVVFALRVIGRWLSTISQRSASGRSWAKESCTVAGFRNASTSPSGAPG